MDAAISKDKTFDMAKYYQTAFPTFFRYIILILLYVFSFIYVFKNPSQFIVFILIFILNFFGALFVLRDIFVNKGVLIQLFNPGSTMSLLGDPPILLKAYLFALIVGILAQVVCLIIIIVVFDYGKKSRTNFTVYKMSSANNFTLYQFKQFFISSTALIGLLTFLILFNYSDEITRNLLRNLLCIGTSLSILGIIGYELFLVVQFLKTKQHRAPLYN